MGKREIQIHTALRTERFIGMLLETLMVMVAVATVLVLVVKQEKGLSGVPHSVLMAVQRVTALAEHFLICRHLLQETYQHRLIARNLGIDPPTVPIPFRQAQPYMALASLQVLARFCVVEWEVLLEN
jgi:hypothetical protein